VSSARIAFIVNPSSANGSTGKAWGRIRERARERLGPFEYHLTEAPGDAIRLAREAVRGGVEILVCVGGDGTLNEMVNGIMGAGGGQGVRLGAIPRGTGCDFSRSAAIPTDLDGALELLAQGDARSLDVGRFTFHDHQGGTSERYFLNILSFGLGGEVVERVNRTTKFFGGFLSFIWATLISIVLYEKKRIRILVDEDFDREVLCWNVAVANGRYHGGGMHVAPDARLDDGLFQVTIVGDLSLPGVFRRLPYLYNGRIYEIPEVTALAGRRIEAASDREVLLDVDGEQPGRLPLTVKVVPRALRFIRPGP